MQTDKDDTACSGPLVSIIIPFYHSYIEFFEECLKSVQQQTYKNWELVVVDDASADERAAAMVKKFLDSRMNFIRHETNRGQAAARNTAILACRGKYFLPLDCDDVLDVTHVEKLVQAVNAQPGANVAYADYRLFFATTGILQLPVRDVRTLLREQWIPHPGTLILRSLWERAQGYCEDEIFRAGNEDWDFFLSVAEIGFHPTRVPEPLYGYRQHKGSISSTRFACSDYLTREYMYLRHQKLFDTHQMKRAFLSGGYRVSAIAFWQKGDWLQALKLILRAVSLSPAESVRILGRRLRRATLSPAG